ncbi:uncharacterized protein MELLADRAFT_86171 [Melampsora larici-populina 98AG31]|uniref:Secreted protein n=1 Tax=Melampsora larici-populina (strain 98AG31 / pathotype 3-4-7) TaxID=747676 RepID=F4RKT0_MELLP|nr:uncharacterized protein MELLADRAFT_86171 [Melampsora larici-populina 98AG31]EGG06782.1 hypothetical protein MELLADRAFT_86171 [Melampsora larici-populina 98AG31]
MVCGVTLYLSLVYTLTIALSAHCHIAQSPVSGATSSYSTHLTIARRNLISKASETFIDTVPKDEGVAYTTAADVGDKSSDIREVKSHTLCKRHGGCGGHTVKQAVKVVESDGLWKDWKFEGENFNFYKTQLSQPGPHSLIDNKNVDQWIERIGFVPTPHEKDELIKWFKTQDDGDALLERFENILFSLERAQLEANRRKSNAEGDSLIWWDLEEMKNALETEKEDHSFPMYVRIREVLHDPTTAHAYSEPEKSKKIQQLIEILGQPTQLNKPYTTRIKAGEGSAGRWGLSTSSHEYIDSLKFGSLEDPKTKQYTYMMKKLLDNVDEVVKKFTDGQALNEAEEAQLRLLALSNGLSDHHVFQLGKLLAKLKSEPNYLPAEDLEILKQDHDELRALLNIYTRFLGKGEIGLRLLNRKISTSNFLKRLGYKAQYGYIYTVKGIFGWLKRIGKYIGNVFKKPHRA